MKKFLLALVLSMMSIVFAGCSSAEKDARKEISERVDAFLKDGSSFSIRECIYSEENDSCFIFSGDMISPKGEQFKTEYIYRQRNNDLLIGVKLVEPFGSLLRNNNIKANTGISADDIVNSALTSSGMGLSVTIYNDLKNGSLLDITNANKE